MAKELSKQIDLSVVWNTKILTAISSSNFHIRCSVAPQRSYMQLVTESIYSSSTRPGTHYRHPSAYILHGQSMFWYCSGRLVLERQTA